MHGNYIGCNHFIWKVYGSDDVLLLSQIIIEKARKEISVFYTKAMKHVLLQKFGRVCPTIGPVVLQALYRDLTND